MQKFSELREIARAVRGFHADERGDENANKLLYFGLVAVPLLLLLMAFKDKIINWFKETVGTLFDSGSGSDPTFG